MKKSWKKSFFGVLVTIIVIGCSGTVSAEAQSVANGNSVAEGKCGNNLEWVLRDTGKLIISGQGSMYDYFDDRAPWYSYRSRINEIMILSGVTTIGSGAFYDCDRVNQVSINSSVQEIGNYAFKECSSISYITFPGSLKKIGDYAFYGTGLGTIEIPISVESIGEGAFASCSGLISATINAPLTRLPEYSFNNCTYLASITLPSSMKEIGEAAFDGCTYLSSIALPSGLTSVGASAFGSTGLKSVVMPDSVTSIGPSAFGNCKNLEKIRLPEELRIIPQSMFGYCCKITGIELPENLAGIGVGAFMGCRSLEEIKIPVSVNSIGSMAFMECTSLQKISCLNSAVSIGDYATYGCNALKKIYGYQESTSEKYARDNGISFAGWDNAVNYSISLSEDSYVYDGSEKQPEIRVTFDGQELSRKSYVVSYVDSVNAGKALVKVSGIGCYKVTLNRTYTIEPKSLADVSAYLSFSSADYTGKEIRPAVALKNGGMDLVQREDYTVTYDNNVNAGVASAIVEGRGNYGGSQTLTYVINQVKQKIIAQSYTKVYGSRKFSLRVKTNGKGKLTYVSGNPSIATVNRSGEVIVKNIGRTTITIIASGSNNFKKTSKKISITVIPKDMVLSSVQSSKERTLLVKWLRNSTADGYQIYYSTDKKFQKNTKAFTINNQEITKSFITGLERNKIYYVKIRAYKKVDGKTYYGLFSKVKSDRS